MVAGSVHRVLTLRKYFLDLALGHRRAEEELLYLVTAARSRRPRLLFLCIEHLAQLPQEHVRRERLLKKLRAGVEEPVVRDRIVGLARHVQYTEVRSGA